MQGMNRHPTLLDLQHHDLRSLGIAGQTQTNSGGYLVDAPAQMSQGHRRMFKRRSIGLEGIEVQAEDAGIDCSRDRPR